MKTNHKPLKNKKIGIASESSRFINDNESCGFWYEDVESAVKGLIEEIENCMWLKALEDTYEGVFKLQPRKHIQELIKKWFPDVVKDE